MTYKMWSHADFGLLEFIDVKSATSYEFRYRIYCRAVHQQNIDLCNLSSRQTKTPAVELGFLLVLLSMHCPSDQDRRSCLAVIRML